MSDLSDRPFVGLENNVSPDSFQAAYVSIREAVSRVDWITNGKARGLFMVDGIKATSRLHGLDLAKESNYWQAESIFRYMNTVAWLVGFINDSFGEELIYIHNFLGDRVDIMSVRNIEDPARPVAALMMFAIILKSVSGVGEMVRCMFGLMGVDWEENHVIWNDRKFTYIDLPGNYAKAARHSALATGIDETKSVLFSSFAQSLAQELVADNILNSDLTVVSNPWLDELHSRSTLELPVIFLRKPEIITTCTCVLSGHNVLAAQKYLLENLLREMGGIIVEGGPDKEKGLPGEGWGWYSIISTEGQIEEVRSRLFSLALQAHADSSLGLKQTTIGITVGTAFWLNIHNRNLVLFPLSAVLSSRVMLNLDEQNKYGVFSIGNIPSKVPSKHVNIRGIHELVEELEPGTPRYLPDFDGRNLANFVVINPLIVLRNFESVIGVLKEALRDDNRISPETYVLIERTLGRKVRVVSDLHTSVIQEWIDKLSLNYQWMASFIGVFGAAMDEAFLLEINAIFYEINPAYALDPNNFSGLLFDTKSLNEPSSLTYSFTTVMSKLALDYVSQPDFQIVLQEMFHLLVGNQSIENIVESPHLPKIIALLKFYKKVKITLKTEQFGAIKSRLIEQTELNRVCLAVCIALQNEGRDFADILSMVSMDFTIPLNFEAKIFILLSLNIYQETNNYLTPELAADFSVYIQENDFELGLDSLYLRRLHSLVLGKVRPYAQLELRQSDIEIETIKADIRSDPEKHLQTVFQIMSMSASLRTLPPSASEDMIKEYVSEAGRLIDKVDQLLRELEQTSSGNKEIVVKLLKEANAILQIRRANHVLMLGDAGINPKAKIVGRCINGLREILEDDFINLIIYSRALTNFIALSGSYRKQGIQLADMRDWTGAAFMNTLLTGGDGFQNIINIFAAFAEERTDKELEIELCKMFQSPEVVESYRVFITEFSGWLSAEKRDLHLVKKFLEAFLGVMFRYGIDLTITDQVDDFLHTLSYNEALMSIIFTKRLRMTQSAIDNAIQYNFFNLNPQMLEAIDNELSET